MVRSILVLLALCSLEANLGFTVSLPEWEATIPSLWDAVEGIGCLMKKCDTFSFVFDTEFVTEYPQYVSADNAMSFLSDNQGKTYNVCHCAQFIVHYLPMVLPNLYAVWSNFEIADLDFWRGEAYQKFFEHLESKGGFYYEVSKGA